MKRKIIRKRSAFVLIAFVAALVLLLSAGCWVPSIVFDQSRPARDMNSETVNGKPTAWGPSPARWLIAADPHRSFSGDEWYFRAFPEYCRRWRDSNGYALPPWPDHKQN